MLLVNASVKTSPIHGLGCFTDERIKEGQIVWRFDERLDRRLPASEVGAFPQPAQEFVRMYAYLETYKGNKVYTLCGDHAKHMNHSTQANLASVGVNQEMDVAVRDIEVGEELTCNYYEFDLAGDEKLTPPAADLPERN